jgi:dTDP-3,4-didehydro-2,6-dideoxy-alpha-D-glucose 3-reductase
VTAPGPLRFGVLGCADIAIRKTVPAIQKTPRASLTAIASRDGARALRTAERAGCAPVHGYQDLLDRDDVDAVYIPLPAALHATWVERALLAGKHVLCEKPLTTSGKTTAWLVDLARSRRLLLMENAMFLRHAQHEKVRALVADGAIGEVRTLVATFVIPPRPAGDHRLLADLGGGALLDLAGYPLRAARFLLGDDLTVAGAVLRNGPGLNVDTRGAALLESATGALAHLIFGMEHAYRSGYELHGTRGRLWLDRAFTTPAGHSPVIHLDKDGAVEELTLPPDDQFANLVGAFTEAALGGKGLVSLGADAVRQAELLDRISCRARTGG